ncbi:hypothetical protein FFJ24_018915 [Pedobacter sp. KBS0701]|uniref:hypothetical protein n=1 Tax=Pedobacter sp. KBS0701 TaxID=2578106 RepID=UPI00110DA9F8|nr:hypothetical protein [Pedobacter sp. KBS0701]QDW26784.1 hypothetical protein FFJ24_018915 [Pedobacter sp. KBS0701]
MENYKNNENEILKAFEIYKNIVFATGVDLSFWKSFMELSINEYKKGNAQSAELFTAGFFVYNLSPINNQGSLKSHEAIRSIGSNELEKYKSDFFSWISNLVILKTYNALEIFILQAIHIKYFSSDKDLIGSKKVVDDVNNEIKTYLKEIGANLDTKNNRHIIQFLKAKSTTISSFLDIPVRIDLNTNWENLFELISILRNVIAHQGTVISSDTHNEIKSKAKDIFQHHFTLVKDENDYINLHPNNEQFSNFLSLFNDLSLNIVKFMFDKEDLKFIGMN